jgi:hypothetical protein
MAYPDGRPIYKLRKVPGSDNGEIDGKPIFMDEASWEIAKSTRTFFSQQLCDPTPQGGRRLTSEYLQDIEKEFIPKDIVKFMVIDPAGDSKDGKGDSWAIHIVGVEPKADEAGLNNVYILNTHIAPMSNSEAIDIIVRMYIGAGVIQKVGIEKATSSILIDEYVVKALKERGRHLSVESGNLVLLKHAGRNKKDRIAKALEWPLNNSKLFISKSIPSVDRDSIRGEMDKFPLGHDDALDALAYLYDMLKDCSLSRSNVWTKKIVYKESASVV